MKGEQQEERIPNFIGNAVIILTAAHLGCEVEMLATAQEVWCLFCLCVMHSCLV